MRHNIFSLVLLLLSLACVSLALQAASSVPPELTLGLNPAGGYELSINGQVWLTSGATSFRAQKTWFTTNPMSTNDVLLLLSSTNYSSGYDDFGTYGEVTLTWQPQEVLTNVMYMTSIRTYKELPNVLVFYQNFDGVDISELTEVSAASNIEISSSFPSFDLNGDFDVQLRWMTYYQNMAGPSFGIWGESMRWPFHEDNNIIYNGGYPGGAIGGAPLVLFDENLNTVVLSPLSNFMVGLQTVSPHSGDFACGLQGMLDTVPLPFSHSSILVAGSSISTTMEQWGSLLLQRKGKTPKGLQGDILTTYLGYWTDNGAFYYYVTEPNKTYADTMLDVSKYVDSLGLPVQYYQFDSWWYYKGINNGVKLWEPMPTIFPDGMAAVVEQMGTLPIALHNRYFSPDNDYIQNYTFIVEQFYALPIDEEMFVHIMSLARTWGLEVYEQDWLITTYLNMQATQNNVTNAAQWLLALGNAAQRVGITVQFCMPLPMHLLQTTELPAVTQARASNDYQPGNSQWRLSATSMLHWSLGIVPFKDNFFSNSQEQPGCNSGYPFGCTEPNSELQSVVASLTAGPVGPSDKLDMLNVTRIMQTCRADGLLLKPDRPAYPHELTFYYQFVQNVTWLDDLWYTYSSFGAGTWHYLLAANLTEPYLLSPSLIGFTAANGVAYNYHQVYSSYAENGQIDASDLFAFNNGSNLVFEASSDLSETVNFEYWIVAPVLNNNWTLLGEIGKHIPVSKQRFVEITDSTNGLLLGIVGGAKETVNLGLLPPADDPIVVSCTLSSIGEAKIECSSKTVSCACVTD